MSQSHDQSEASPPVFKSTSKLGTHVSTNCIRDESLSRPCPARDTTADPPCRGVRCTLSLSRAQTSSRWCGVVVRRGGCQLKCCSHHFTLVQDYEVRRQKPSGS
ncbi:hypothetical protein TNCV_2494681 [Trichonephila clavipes]|uniref:Uncharacterized protein n=1 Tax=Trichonephila clavipes TaxID=2585209 RepID=A0A8X6V8Z4_TRICX|nr:hypothetical protein TNCV_2494681 [Trichonephila clavipes]